MTQQPPPPPGASPVAVRPWRHPHRPELDVELEGLRDRVRRLGVLVTRAIERAMWGLLRRSAALCDAVVEDDAEVNDLQRDVRERAFQVVLTQQPVAGDLREIMGLLHMSSELERMADHAVSIAKIARRLADLPPLEPGADLERMAAQCTEQVRDVLDAVMRWDEHRAREVAARDDRIDRLYHRLFDALVELMTEDRESVYRATNLVFIAHHLERIADRVTNIAEDLIFTQTGVIEDLG